MAWRWFSPGQWESRLNAPWRSVTRYPPVRTVKVRGAVPSTTAAVRKGLSPLAGAIFIIAGLLIALIFVLAIVSVIFPPAIMRTLDKRELAILPQPSAAASTSLA